jgi:hypothetical protein
LAPPAARGPSRFAWLTPPRPPSPAGAPVGMTNAGRGVVVPSCGRAFELTTMGAARGCWRRRRRKVFREVVRELELLKQALLFRGFFTLMARTEDPTPLRGWAVFGGVRWLAPTANFRRPSGPTRSVSEPCLRGEGTVLGERTRSCAVLAGLELWVGTPRRRSLRVAGLGLAWVRPSAGGGGR